MNRPLIPSGARKLLKAITGKRARIVVDHLLKHGSITTDQLREDYGYDHPPRAIRDVKDQGVPIAKTMVRKPDGGRMAEYRFGDLSRIRTGKLGGRRAFPKKFKTALLGKYGERCGICYAILGARYLQIDHRIPYEVAGDTSSESERLDRFMLVCASCNRAKSWSCEHCRNWAETRIPKICRQCYWAHPESYKHVAMRDWRRLDLVWTDDEVPDYERLRKHATAREEPMPQYVKDVLRRSLARESK
ncbi:MAG: HNH endonuclease [Phycisphaerae bacterium]|nr:HNH endonuclease [Phycisphaerae bacterium]